MRQIRTLGVALIAMLALGAIMASGASASLPETGKCEAKAGGKYADSACVALLASGARKTQGHYEWHTGVQVEEEGHCTNCGVEVFEINVEHNGRGSIGPTTFETTGGHEIICADTEDAHGHQTAVRYKLQAPNRVNEILLYFTNCKEAAGEHKECYSPGHSLEEEGEGGVITDENQWQAGEAIKGKLEIVAGKGTATPTVGLALTAFNSKSEDNEQRRLLTAECEGAMGTVWIGGETKAKNGKDEILSVVSPADVDQMTSTLTQTFSENAGIQEPHVLESGSPRFLEAFLENGWEQLGWASTWGASSEGTAVEIKAVP